MLSLKNRLKNKKDIERVLKEGERVKEDFLIFKKAKNNLKKIRIGFIVSQKISKRANIRNKIKRRLRSLVRSKLNNLKNGFDVLIIAVPGIEKKDFWDIEETLNKLFKKVKLSNDKNNYS